MSVSATSIPFVDLSFQHQPLQDLIEKEVRALLQQGDFILGQSVSEFEAAFAAVCNVEYGIGVASGTDAIALGLQACGIKTGDEVILPTNTFVATLIGVLETGATPILVDCDPRTALIDLVAAAKAVTSKTRAIIPVHLYGQMVSPRLLLDLAHTHDLLIFEDAAQAHMAEREGYRAGSIGIAAAFSFYPSKNLGAIGDAGMVVTQDETVAQTVRSLRNYGSLRKYFHTDPGINSRLDSLQAAVLKIKLPYLAKWNTERHQLAQHYHKLLQPLQVQGIHLIENQSDMGHIYHLYVIRVTAECPVDRTTIQEGLTNRGIQSGIHYPIPCHLQPAFKYLGYKVGDFPYAEMLCHEILSLPIYPGMELQQVEQVVQAIQQIIEEHQSFPVGSKENTL